MCLKCKYQNYNINIYVKFENELTIRKGEGNNLFFLNFQVSNLWLFRSFTISVI